MGGVGRRPMRTAFVVMLSNMLEVPCAEKYEIWAEWIHELCAIGMSTYFVLDGDQNSALQAHWLRSNLSAAVSGYAPSRTCARAMPGGSSARSGFEVMLLATEQSILSWYHGTRWIGEYLSKRDDPYKGLAWRNRGPFLLDWYSRVDRAYEHVWVVEHDVFLGGSLRAFAEWYAPSRSDLIAAFSEGCADVGEAREYQNDTFTWPLADELRVHKWEKVERLSRRLLQSMADAMALGLTAWGELFASSLCAALPWCRRADLAADGWVNASSCAATYMHARHDLARANPRDADHWGFWTHKWECAPVEEGAAATTGADAARRMVRATRARLPTGPRPCPRRRPRRRRPLSCCCVRARTRWCSQGLRCACAGSLPSLGRHGCVCLWT